MYIPRFLERFYSTTIEFTILERIRVVTVGIRVVFKYGERRVEFCQVFLLSDSEMMGLISLATRTAENKSERVPTHYIGILYLFQNWGHLNSGNAINTGVISAPIVFEDCKRTLVEYEIDLDGGVVRIHELVDGDVRKAKIDDMYATWFTGFFKGLTGKDIFLL